MGWAPALIAAAGTSVQLLSQKQGQKQEQALFDLEQRRLTTQAAAVRSSAMEEQFYARQDLKRTVAQNLALTAKGGVRPTGSPLMANLLAIQDSATNIGIIGFNAEQEARTLESGADVVGLQKKFAKQAGTLSQFSTILGGMTTQADLKYRRDYRKGLITGEAKVS